MGDLVTAEISSATDKPQPTLQERYDAQQNPPTPTSKEVPDYIPTKFRTAEDPIKAMAESYAELEKKQSGTVKAEEEIPANDDSSDDADEEAEKVPDDTNTDDQDSVDDSDELETDIRTKTEAAGVDVDAMARKFWEQGSLEEDDYAALEKSGYSRAQVDSYAEGQKALVRMAEEAIFEAAGSEDQAKSVNAAEYKAMIQWAGDNLTQEEQDAFNETIYLPPDRKNMPKILMAVKGLKAQYKASEGFEPTKTITPRSYKPGVESYGSQAEMVRDQSKPEYKTDPAFRKKVMQKVANSSF